MTEEYARSQQPQKLRPAISPSNPQLAALISPPHTPSHHDQPRIESASSIATNESKRLRRRFWRKPTHSASLRIRAHAHSRGTHTRLPGSTPTNRHNCRTLTQPTNRGSRKAASFRHLPSLNRAPRRQHCGRNRPAAGTSCEIATTR